MEPVQEKSAEKISQAIHLLEEATSGEATHRLEQVKSAYNNIREETSKRAKIIDRDAHESPWRYMAMTAAAGVGLGVLLARRNS